MEIVYHKYSWQCPKCKEYKRVRDTGQNLRRAKCCNVVVEIKTGLVAVQSYELQIDTVTHIE